MLSLYQEEKCRRIECEKQAERLVHLKLNPKRIRSSLFLMGNNIA
jgi:hypothetical protein